MKNIVYCYIQNYYTCRWVKAFKNQYNSLLKLLLILFYLENNIILDFMIGLLLNNSYNMVLMILNWLIKEKYYILYIKNKNSITTKATTYLLLKIYSLPLSLILSQGFYFILGVWKIFYKIFDIIVNISRIFYLKIDGQSKIAN